MHRINIDPVELDVIRFPFPIPVVSQMKSGYSDLRCISVDHEIHWNISKFIE